MKNNLVMDIRDFYFTYAGVDSPSLNGINLPINKHRITALIGPSGCGKSTLLRSMNRIHDLYPNNRYRGEIILYNKNGFGENILDIKRENDFIKLRHRVGMIFQKLPHFR